MSDDISLLRRSFVAGLLCAPAAVSAAPLIDLDRGVGLFNGGGRITGTRDELRMLNLYTQEASVASEELQFSGNSVGSHPMKLRLQNANTDERLVIDLPGSLRLGQAVGHRLSHFLRDWRKDEVLPIDQKVLDDLIKISGSFATPGNVRDIRITSGYRTRETNELLRQRGYGVARNSLHMVGKAIDFSLPGINIRELSIKAQEFCGGGVGTYSTFVHIDSGSARRWAA